MREPERKFTIYYWSEVSAEISLIRGEAFSNRSDATVIAKARHPSGTGMANWYHFVDDDKVPVQLRDVDCVRASANINECENERDAILQCLTNLADKLWHGMHWKVEREEDFDKDVFYKDILQAFIVGEWNVDYGRVSEDALPPKALSTRSPNE